MFLPTWTKPAVWSAGRDPLGMQATSVRLYRELAPGLTNVTNRLRYFSFYCWVIAAYERRHHAADLARWQIFIRRAEAVYALSSQTVDAAQSLGMAGGDWAARMRNGFASAPTQGPVDLTAYTDTPGGTGQYLKAKGGNFGQFYVASMLEVGMLTDFKVFPIVSDRYGRDLAGSFAASIGGVEQVLLDAIETGTLDQQALAEIGAAAHPARIPADGEEMALLKAYLLGEKPQLDGSDQRRRSSAWLRLALMQRGVGPQDDRALRRAFYSRVAPDGSAIEVTGETIDGWRAYQANEYGHIALECLLNGVISCLKQHGGVASPDTLIDALLDVALGSSDARASWAAWAREASEQTDEDELAGPVLRTIAQGAPGHAEIWLSALKLLGMLWAKWADNQQGLMHQIARGAGPTGRSLAGVLDTLNGVSNGGVADALRRALQRHVVSEHMAIAGQKLAGAGTFTYHFLLADGEMSEGQLGTYGYTNPRLQNLARFMGDAGLHEDGKVTPSGEGFLRAHQAH
jgi:hypothetical protein